MNLIDWAINHLSSEMIIEGYEILSDLIDIELTEAEKCETAYFDSMADATVNNNDSNVPLGKRVC